MSDDAEGMRDAEAAEPGFVHRHGWTHLRCPDCEQVIYDGRRINSQDTGELLRAHALTCGG